MGRRKSVIVSINSGINCTGQVIQVSQYDTQRTNTICPSTWVPGNLNMEIDQMNFFTSGLWNQGNNNINKMVNESMLRHLMSWGARSFSQSASLNKPNPQEIIQSMAEVIDNRPLAQKMQDLSKGALVKELTNAYAVRTEYSNSNFGMNTISKFTPKIMVIWCIFVNMMMQTILFWFTEG